jgi:hypothetical protein
VDEAHDGSAYEEDVRLLSKTRELYIETRERIFDHLAGERHDVSLPTAAPRVYGLAIICFGLQSEKRATGSKKSSAETFGSTASNADGRSHGPRSVPLDTSNGCSQRASASRSLHPEARDRLAGLSPA